MSASDKKKLRKEQASQFLTEKQRQEQAEAKKLKIYTISFVSAMLLVVAIALAVVGVRAFEQSGIVQKSTIAATVGDKELNSVELGYYYTDAVQDYYNGMYEQYTTYTDTYLQIMGLDTKKPLNEQKYPGEENKTWAEYFLQAAVDQAKNDYALYNKAMSENFELPEEEREGLKNLEKNLDTYATLYGYSNANKYLSAMYGFGSNIKTYSAYAERSAIATAYYNAHKDSLTYNDEAIRKYESDKFANFNSYDYSSSYLTYTEFLQGGKKGEDGNTTYSDKEKADARAAMEAAAKEAAKATSLDDLKKKVKEIKVNEKSQTAVNSATDVLHTEINEELAKWLSNADRKKGDIGAIPVYSTTKDKDGKEVKELNGYYIAYFESKNENKEPMGNVRHLLVKFKGGTEDEETGETVYSDAEKKTAKEKAEGFLKTWKEGKADENSFIELVKKNSDDTSAAEGGLFEDINPDSNYVPSFLEWSINPDRKAGDTGVIESPYGYHVMFYVGDDELSYRDFMIQNELRDADQEKWYEAILEPVAAKLADTSKLNLDLVLAAG